MNKPGLDWERPNLFLRLRVKGSEAARLVRLARLPNWLVHDGKLERWSWDSHREEEGMLVWCKNFDALDADWQKWNASPHPLEWKHLKSLLEILIVLAVNDQLSSAVRPSLMLWNGEDRALGLNRVFLEKLNQILPLDETDFSPPSESLKPWSAWFGGQIVNFLARTTTVPVLDQDFGWELRTLELREDLARLVTDSQTPGKEPELGRWRQLMIEAPDGPPLRQPSTEDIELRESMRRRAKAIAPLKRRVQHIRDFVRNNARLLAVAALVAGVLILPEFCVLGRNSSLAVTQLSDEDALFGYYEAINGLRASDIRLLSQSPEARQDAWEAGQLYVFRETRRATLGDAGLISLTDWRKQGEPPLGEGLTVYGVDLVLVQRLEPEVFEVTYHRARWDRDKVEGRPVLENVVDRIRLDRQSEATRLVFLKREVRSL